MGSARLARVSQFKRGVVLLYEAKKETTYGWKRKKTFAGGTRKKNTYQFKGGGGTWPVLHIENPTGEKNGFLEN